jgi:pilus assembly protein FimV
MIVAATRVPQRAQKTSTPGVTGSLHEAQTARDSAGGRGSDATRPPHFGQKGNDGSTAVPQLGHGAFPGGMDASGGTLGPGRTGGTAGAPGAAGDPGAGGAFDTRVAGTPNFALGS